MENKNNVVLVIHGGAGKISKITPEREKACKLFLDETLNTCFKILKDGGTSLDTVEKAVRMLEDSPLFNAGKGSVFTHDEKNEMDAAIMCGKTLKAGSVAGVTNIKNPISAARKVMENTQHVMLISKGAEKFAKSQGLEIVPKEYFYTEERFQQLKKIQSTERIELDSFEIDTELKKEVEQYRELGTVGAVALDKNGNLASATSTGGLTNKKFGRVGDSPIIGSGTYANNNTCAVSVTGQGEAIMLSVLAYDISALMEYKNLSLKEATNEVVMNKLLKLGADAGVIAVDKNGNFEMIFNTLGMYRGYMKSNSDKGVYIFRE